MTFLCRLLVVCLFALFAVRGASACESMAHSAPPATHVMRMAGAHCNMADRTNHDSHGSCHANCCIAGCCGHCAAPPLAFHFGTHAAGRATVAARAVALHAGITHAPPLPPPIA